MNPLIDKIAKLFHTYYELLAPECGYSTRKETAVAWEDVPDPNKQLMRATVDAVLMHFWREANFQNGDDVEVTVPVLSQPGVLFAKKGEVGKLQIRDGDYVVKFAEERWWATVDFSEVVLHFKVVDDAGKT